MPESPGIQLKKFVVPEIVYGEGARLLTGQYTSIFQADIILMVTDPGVIKSGITEQILFTLDRSEIHYTIFSDIY